MRTLHAVLLANALGLLAIPLVFKPAEACFTCTSSQECTSGSDGSSCSMEVVDGSQWCQHSLDCGTEMTLTPLHVSPAGTYLDTGGARLIEDTVEKLACNGFIVARTGDVRETVREQSIRI